MPKAPKPKPKTSKKPKDSAKPKGTKDVIKDRYTEAVEALKQAAGGDWNGPAVDPADVDKATKRADDADTGKLRDALTDAAKKSTTQGIKKGGVLGSVVKVLVSFVGGLVAEEIGNRLWDWFTKEDEAEKLAESVDSAAENVEKANANADAAGIDVANATCEQIKLIAMCLGLIDKEKDPQAYVDTLHNGDNLINQCGATLIDLANERDRCIASSYNMLLEHGAEVCGCPAPELPAACDAPKPALIDAPRCPATTATTQPPAPAPEPAPAPAPTVPAAAAPECETKPEEPKPESPKPESPKPEEPKREVQKSTEKCPVTETASVTKLEPPAHTPAEPAAKTECGCPEKAPEKVAEKMPEKVADKPAPVPETPKVQCEEVVTETATVVDECEEVTSEKRDCSGVGHVVGIGVALLVVGALIELALDFFTSPETPNLAAMPEPAVPEPSPEPCPDAPVEVSEPPAPAPAPPPPPITDPAQEPPPPPKKVAAMAAAAPEPAFVAEVVEEVPPVVEADPLSAADPIIDLGSTAQLHKAGVW